MTFNQREFDIRFEWGLQGIWQLAPISDVVIIVDVLSFSTCVDIAVSNGAIVFPYANPDSGLAEYARRKDAHAATTVRTGSAEFSLSPHSLLTIPSGYRLVLPSPNGGALSLATASTTTLTGCLRNYSSVAQAANRHGRIVAVIAAGERWTDGSLRPCVEDLIGAGAILSHLSGRRSPEAEAAIVAFEGSRPVIERVMSRCGSGKELIDRGFGADVSLAAALDVSGTVPVLRESAFIQR